MANVGEGLAEVASTEEEGRNEQAMGKGREAEEKEKREVDEEGGEGNDVDEDVGGAAEEDDNFVPGKRLTLQEQLEMDKEDESLRKWKEQLLGSLELEEGASVSEPEVIFKSLTLLIQDRDSLDLPLPKLDATQKGPPPHFVLKEGSLWRLKFEFLVKKELVLGLTYWRKVTRLGAQVDKTKIMLGTYAPQKDPYLFETKEEATPSGMLARGKYHAKTGFSDDDGKTHLEMEYTFEIRKDW